MATKILPHRRPKKNRSQNTNESNSEETLVTIRKKKIVEEEHEEHVDERWLISYADMMTLLFGLFVMLYAMQSPESFKKVQESIKSKFQENENHPPEDKQDPQLALKEALDKLQKLIPENEKLTHMNSSLTDEVATSKTTILNLNQVNSQLDEQNKKITEELKVLQDRIKDLTKDDPAKTNLDEIVSIKEKLKNREVELESTKVKLKDNEIIVKKLLEKQAESVTPKEDFQAKNLELKKENEELLAQIKNLNDKVANLDQRDSFLAIILSWFTTDHDLDLVITDPNGKKFNYKSKQYPNYPGKMVLDTRRGPGAEIWQANTTISGKYTIEVIFYNQYGNASPAEGRIGIFSSKTDIEIPITHFDMNKNNKQKIIIEVSQNGNLKLLP